MKSYDPEWREGERGKAHLIAKDTSLFGYDPNPRTLCGRSARKLEWPVSRDPERCSRCEAALPKVREGLRDGANVGFLDERSYVGRVAGASHYSGSLYLGEVPGVDLTFCMTYLQARAENAKDPSYDGWEAGSLSNRFFTREALLERALEKWREIYPEARALMLGPRRACSPCKVLVVVDDDQAVVRLNEIHRRWEGLEHDRKASDAVETEWEALLAEKGLST